MSCLILNIAYKQSVHPDGISPEALKADPETTADMLTPLLHKVWEEGKVPTDWRKGYLAKLPKKGDLRLCKNWRGIMLLSTPSKILSRIILERIKDALDTELQPEQAGFRKGKSCSDQIATLRIIIIEQSMEWQSNFYLNFIDFEKAFESVDREVIWKVLKYYGVPQIFNLIQQLYDNGGTCQVIHNGKISEAFGVNTGVRQGCLLSPIIFLIVMDWIMCQTVGNEKTGISWTDVKNLEDLNFTRG
uniref:Reverse transcriptase domain-containing protein n=1 Tax=Trichobilharzia regenti TaxID=157069 RepID=A0AA85K5E6_TRIRE|nr:unnamed protein product [Trichobilharzia regenti]